MLDRRFNGMSIMSKATSTVTTTGNTNTTGAASSKSKANCPLLWVRIFVFSKSSQFAEATKLSKCTFSYIKSIKFPL